jgi:hypothetical protein
VNRYLFFFPSIVCVLVLGCQPEAKPSVFESKHGEHGHSHDRDKMMLKDYGKIHVGLTAHISKKTGNELDLVFETEDKEPAPAPQPFSKLIAKATRQGEDKSYELVFEPAEKEERKDDPEGKCSRYTAKAPWMKPDDMLTVRLPIDLNGQEKIILWVDFNPLRYAHFIDKEP